MPLDGKKFKETAESVLTLEKRNVSFKAGDFIPIFVKVKPDGTKSRHIVGIINYGSVKSLDKIDRKKIKIGPVGGTSLISDESWIKDLNPTEKDEETGMWEAKFGNLGEEDLRYLIYTIQNSIGIAFEMNPSREFIQELCQEETPEFQKQPVISYSVLKKYMKKIKFNILGTDFYLDKEDNPGEDKYYHRTYYEVELPEKLFDLLIKNGKSKKVCSKPNIPVLSIISASNIERGYVYGIRISGTFRKSLEFIQNHHLMRSTRKSIKKK